MGVMILSKSSFIFLAPLFMKNIIGCAPSAPDGSSPWGYSRIFSGIDSKNEFFFSNPSVPFTSIFCRLPWSSSIRRYVTPDFFVNVFPTSVHHCHSLISRYSNSRDVINIITPYVILTWRWPLFVGSAVISQFSCPLVGCRFRSSRHVSAHVPSSESYIRRKVGDLLLGFLFLCPRVLSCTQFFPAP
jgi:hypothetical protein